MTAGGNRGDVRRRLAERYRRLDEARKKHPAAAVAARFTEIDGATQGGIVSIELFTTILPLIIIGFDYMSGFAENASPGTLLTRQLGLVSPLTERVRAAFGDSAGFRSGWTFVGVGGFLVWGIPMSITIAGIFAKAWRREQFGLGQRLLRGATWFVLYLMTIGIRERIALGVAEHHGVSGAIRLLLFAISLVPVWIFWSLTPVLLVRNGGRGGLKVPRARRAGRGTDRRNDHPARRADLLPDVAPRLGRFGSDRRRNGVADVVRGDRRRMGRDSVCGRGPVGARSPIRNRHRVTDRRRHRIGRITYSRCAAPGRPAGSSRQSEMRVCPGRRPQWAISRRSAAPSERARYRSRTELSTDWRKPRRR